METQFQLPHLPLEILEEIFLRLPIKSIIQFKLLSKFWAFLFSSIEFQRRYHGLRVCEGPTSLVIEPQYQTEGLHRFLSHAFTDLDDREPDHDLRDVIASRGFPGTHPDCPNPNPRLLGSWNGLVALFDGVDQFMLWNPCTEECNVVPMQVSLHDDICSSLFLLGLCLDATNDEYMAVVVNYYVDPPRVPMDYRANGVDQKECAIGYLISFKSGKGEELTKCCPINTMSFYEQVGTIINGIPHWLETEKPKRIFYFNHADKDFKEMSYPRVDDKKVICGLGALHGQLTVAFQCPHKGDHAEFEIWAMKNYGVQESWTKSMVIPGMLAGLSPYDSLALLGFTSDGEIVVDVNGDIITEQAARDKFMDNKLMAYNPGKKSIRSIIASYYGTGASKATYVPTLVSPY